MSHAPTLAPSRAKRWAMARPMPDPAPVTTATLPASCTNISRSKSLAGILATPLVFSAIGGSGIMGAMGALVAFDRAA